jgi:hypothetical protein
MPSRESRTSLIRTTRSCQIPLRRDAPQTPHLPVAPCTALSSSLTLKTPVAGCTRTTRKTDRLVHEMEESENARCVPTTDQPFSIPNHWREEIAMLRSQFSSQEVEWQALADCIRDLPATTSHPTLTLFWVIPELEIGQKKAKIGPDAVPTRPLLESSR